MSALGTLTSFIDYSVLIIGLFAGIGWLIVGFKNKDSTNIITGILLSLFTIFLVTYVV